MANCTLESKTAISKGFMGLFQSEMMTLSVVLIDVISTKVENSRTQKNWSQNHHQRHRITKKSFHRSSTLLNPCLSAPNPLFPPIHLIFIFTHSFVNISINCNPNRSDISHPPAPSPSSPSPLLPPSFVLLLDLSSFVHSLVTINPSSNNGPSPQRTAPINRRSRRRNKRRQTRWSKNFRTSTSPSRPT